MQEPKSDSTRHPFLRGRIARNLLVGFFAFAFCCAFLRVSGPDSWNVLPRLAAAEEVAKKGEDADTKSKKSGPSITVYVTSWCPACSMAIKYLKQKKVPFTVKDVEKNPDYMKEMVGKVGGYRGVPVMDIDGKTYLGFNPTIIDQIAD